ncbi:MAG: methyltransferase domain-containing protein [Alphaproteobacteria bacterium]|nr:methyltransferase domain-containing protein [Alphaproteobacteria bacterium]
MPTAQYDDFKRNVRETYGRIAAAETTGCGCSCSTSSGYSQGDLDDIPEGADLGLGSGGGIDCFLAAKSVGQSGHVIGVDMTPEMISRARSNALEGGYDNVEFRLGEIENLPVADGSVDVIMSNCVVNLSTEKASVYGEAFRVLKPGGRLAISDVVTTANLPDEARGDLERHAACISGAASINELRAILGTAGFTDVRIQPKNDGHDLPDEWAPGSDISEYTVSAMIQAVKPVS